MKKRLRDYAAIVSCGLVLAVMLHRHDNIVTAQEADTKKTTAEKKEDVNQPRKKARGRLPNYFGKIGISTAQREKIYAIQSQYRMQMEELEKQIQALREMQVEDIQAVLTDDQKSLLGKLLDEAQKRRSSRGRKTPAKDEKPAEKEK